MRPSKGRWEAPVVGTMATWTELRNWSGCGGRIDTVDHCIAVMHRRTSLWKLLEGSGDDVGELRGASGWHVWGWSPTDLVTECYLIHSNVRRETNQHFVQHTSATKTGLTMVFQSNQFIVVAKGRIAELNTRNST